MQTLNYGTKQRAAGCLLMLYLLLVLCQLRPAYLQLYLYDFHRNKNKQGRGKVLLHMNVTRGQHGRKKECPYTM